MPPPPTPPSGTPVRSQPGALLARGCAPGDRVAFALGSSADLICAVLGATLYLAAGASARAFINDDPVVELAQPPSDRLTNNSAPAASAALCL